MGIPGGKRRRRQGHAPENQLNAKIDRYERLREMEEKFLPAIREDLKNGLTADQILKKYEPHAAAALVTSLANPTQSLAAAEKVLDRTQGKPTQKTETTHRFEKLSESELDSFLTSQLTDLDASEKKDVQ